MILVYKISKFIHFIDVKTMQPFEIDKPIYWQHCFRAVLGRDRLSEFVVINIENMDNDFNSSRAALKQKFRQVSMEIARKEDFGVNDKTFIVNTHLGDVLNYNDTVLGYDLIQSNLNDIDEFTGKDLYLPEIVLVKKTYPKQRKRQRNRLWKLKHFEDQDMPQEKEEENEGMDPENSDDEDQTQKKKKGKKEKKKRKERNKKPDTIHGASKKEYETFLQDLEEDAELRQQVNLYRDDDVIKELEMKIQGMTLDDKVKEDEKDQRQIKKAVRKTAEGKESAT